MLTISAFASLAQLGSGLALALSIFLEPITFRERRYRDRLQRELLTTPKDGRDQNQDRVNDLYCRIIELDAAAKRAHELAYWPLLLVKVGAALNFAVLVAATITPDAEVDDRWCWMLLATCVAPVLLGSGWLVAIAQVKIGSLERSFCKS